MATVPPTDLDERLAASAYEAWQRDLLAKRSAEQILELDSLSREGIEIRALAHHAGVDPRWRVLGARKPGDFPHLRGFDRQGSRTLCLQERNEADVTVVGARLREEAERGVLGAWLRLDASIMAEGQAASTLHDDGVALKTLAALISLWRGMPEEQQPQQWRVECGALSAREFAQDRDLATVQSDCPGLEFAIDPLAALVRRGEIAGSMEDHYGALREVLALGDARRGGKFHLLIGADQFHEAGAHAAYELALSLAAAAEYARALCQSGGDLELAADEACLQFSVGGDLFMDVAKLRAARVLHTCLLEACGVRGTRLRIHARTSRRCLSLDDPWTNLLRTTLGSYAAFVGGADSQAIVPHGGELLPEGPSARAGRRLAANLHHLLGDEAQLATVADPGGGSYHLESVTSALARKAWQEFQAIEAAGGLLTCLRLGRVQNRLAQQRAEQVEALSLGERCLVGATLHAVAGERGCRGRFRGVDYPAQPAPSERRDHAAMRGQVGPANFKIDRVGTLRWAHDFEALRGSIEAMVGAGRARPRALLVSDELSAKRRAVLDWAADRFRVLGLAVCGESSATDYSQAPPHDLVVLCIDAEPSTEGGDTEVSSRAREVTALIQRNAATRLCWASRTPASTASAEFADFSLAGGRPQLSEMARIAAWCTGTSVELSTSAGAEV